MPSKKWSDGSIGDAVAWADSDYLLGVQGGASIRVTKANLLKSNVADGAGAIGHTLNTSNALVTAGAKIASFKNNDVEKAYIDKDGAAIFGEANFIRVIGSAGGGYTIQGNTSSLRMLDGAQTAWVRVSTGGVGLGTTNTIDWGANGGESSLDAGIARVAAASLKITDGSTGFGDITCRRILSMQVGDNATCVAVGGNSLGSAVASTNWCTAVGEGSLASTTVDSNSGFGYNAGNAITTGNNNSLFGYAAGQAGNWSKCVVLGALAGASASGTLSDSVIAGYATCRYAGVLTQSVVLGASAGAGNDGFSNSVVIGFEAGKGVNFAHQISDLCAVGHQSALRLEATATANTFTGNLSGDNVSTGDNNSLFGKSAGTTITTGSGNICVGQAADVSAGTAAGQFTIGVGVACDQDNQITIGNASGTMKNEFDTDNAWTQASDGRRKNVLSSSVIGLQFLERLNPIRFNWKPASEFPEEWGIDPHTDIDTETVMHGFLAQEVKEALEICGFDGDFGVWKEERNGMQRVSRELLIIPLVNAVKELHSRLRSLEAQSAPM